MTIKQEEEEEKKYIVKLKLLSIRAFIVMNSFVQNHEF